MTEKEIKEETEAAGEVKETRVKSGVIRRRRAPKKVEAAPPPPPETPAPEAPEGTEVAAGAVPGEEAKEVAAASGAEAKVEGKAKAKPKAKVPEPELTPEEIVAAAAEAPEAAEEGPAKGGKPSKAGKAGKKGPAPEESKEVTVFGKEAPGKRKFTPTIPAFSKGKGKRRFKGNRPFTRKQTVNANRPLLKTEITKPSAEKMVVKITDTISVGDLSQALGVKAGELIKKLMSLGVMATVNQFIDFDTAQLIASDYNYEVENVAIQEETLIGSASLVGEEGKNLKSRPPVVTVMGHVDHGKTSLLDAVRNANVVSGEAGGITQHIGAHHVHLDSGDITFLDTPGHEAFTAMRSRGAGVTDIVILVVAANDGVMPQTVEAINHAKAAEVPIIVAVNKIDLPEADPNKIRQELANLGLQSEDWGGDTIFAEVSAKTGQGLTELLEMVLLQADMLELKADDSVAASGVIVEAKLDKGRGAVATVLVQSGTLNDGDAFVTGVASGRVRAMMSDWGKKIRSAGPSMPAEITGLSHVPSAGDTFVVVKDEVTARQIATMRQNKAVEVDSRQTSKVSLEDLYAQITQGEAKDLNIIIKADVQGSIEAVIDSLGKIKSDIINVKVIHSAVGGITEGDCMLASASNAIVVGFNVRPETKATIVAEKETVEIKLYNVIYDLIEDVKAAMEGLLDPVIKEEVQGTVEIREVFRITKVGNIAGCYVTDGKVTRSSLVRLIRDNVVIYDGELSSLKRFKDDTKEVKSGFECGLSIAGYNDMKVGDVVEAYIKREEAAKL